jgi:uncharacterized membrane protein
VSTNRLEAFSDGVLAVAITLLVLNLTVPLVGSSMLAHKLATMWPDYLAYVTSFVTIGIIWINHHAMIGRLREADHSILVVNMLLLMSVVVIPFATNLMATYLKDGGGAAHLTAGIYSGTLLVMSLLFTALNRQILVRKPDLLRVQLPAEARQQIWKRAFAGVVPYVIATALAPISAYLTVAICFAVAAFYATPLASSAGAETASLDAGDDDV